MQLSSNTAVATNFTPVIPSSDILLNPGLTQVRFQVPEPRVPTQLPSITKVPVDPAIVSQVPLHTSSASHISGWNPPMTTQHNSSFNLPGSENRNHSQNENPGSSSYRSNVSGQKSLSRSGISYSGSPSGITVDMFLFQVEAVAMSLGLPEEALMFELSTVLKDIALQWYWTYRRHHPQVSWSDLKRDFVERFKDRRTDYEVRRAIEARKQHANESFMDYYHHVWALTLQCRIPYHDEEFIQLLMSNMKPALQYHLTDQRFATINDLIKSCTAWEDTFKRFRVPPDNSMSNRRTINEVHMTDYGLHVAPEVKINSPITETYESVSAYQTINKVLKPPAQFANNIRSNNRPKSVSMGYNPICFNCSDVGHTFKDCSVSPTGIFCYRCGLRGTITPRCSRCAENLPRDQWRSGIQGLPKTFVPRKTQEAASNLSEIAADPKR